MAVPRKRKRPGTNVTDLIQPTSPHVSQAQVDCHAEGHQWRPMGVVDPSQAEAGMKAPWGGNGTVGRRSHCVSCQAERIRWYTRSGEVVNRYRYQDGYLHKREAGDLEPAPTRQEWRQRLVVSLFTDLGTPQQQKRGRRA